MSEWCVFKRAFLKETKMLMEKEKLKNHHPCKQSHGIYVEFFIEIFKLLNIILVLPVGTASVERSFSYMKTIKTRLRNRISDTNLIHLMRIAIEGPELPAVNFNEILDIFKERNRRLSQ